MDQASEELVLRGFNYCVIDEVDSILIDEARTPLIISGELHALLPIRLFKSAQHRHYHIRRPTRSSVCSAYDYFVTAPDQ